MIEDDDPKIRRNLLVFSFLVVLAWWFDLQPGELAAKVLNLDTKLDPLKLCTAALVTLTYLALRYKDAQLVEKKKYRDVLRADLTAITPAVVRHYAQLMANLYTWTGFEASIFLGKLEHYLKKRRDEMDAFQQVRAKNHSGRPMIWLTQYRQGVGGELNEMIPTGELITLWQIGTLVQWGGEKVRGSVATGDPLSVQVAGFHRYLVWAYSRAWWFFYCESAIRARIPVLLGLFAVGILCFKIAALLVVR